MATDSNITWRVFLADVNFSNYSVISLSDRAVPRALLAVGGLEGHIKLVKVSDPKGIISNTVANEMYTVCKYRCIFFPYVQ